MITENQLLLLQDSLEDVPAEIVMEQARFGGWLWFICQPDQAWGVWDQSVYKYGDKEKAFTDAREALRKVWIKQGILENYESLPI